MVAYRNLDTNRFVAHMNYEHGAYFDMEFLLAACLMDEEERKAVRNVMELKHKAQQEKGREGEERRGEKRPLIVEQRKETQAPPPPPVPAPRQIPAPVPVKEEVPDEVRVLPEKWEGPKTKPSFTCGVCDKTFLLLKYLQAHQKKACHSSPSPSPPSPVTMKPQEAPRPPSAHEFKCGQCQYSGSRERDLRLHVTKKHWAVPGTPPPPSPTLPKPSSAPGPDNVFSSLSNSWTKNKEISKEKEVAKEKEASVDKEISKPKPVKSEPKEASLEEMTAAVGDNNESMETEDPDDPDPAEENQASSPVEDTTFISFDNEASSTSSVPVTSHSEEEDTTLQVDVGKSKYFKANPQTVSVQVDSKIREQYDVIDDKLPVGWKVREIEHEFKSGKKETKRHYLTPDNKALKTGLAVLEYMRLSSRYSAKEIMDYAKYLAVPVNRLEKYMELYL